MDGTKGPQTEPQKGPQKGPQHVKPGDEGKLREKFWERYELSELTRPEWEALCDGCGKCCLHKLEDEVTGEVALTMVACRLLDNDTGLCRHYENRHAYVPDCITLTPETVVENAYWLPKTCAYRLRLEGKPLYDWHPLISGDPESVHRAGVSMRGRSISEEYVPEEDWDNYIIDEPMP